ncbi:peptidoglycan D,D-transpeptidase FtsI family protein [Roseburia intestinalis]|uniref:Penicillin-binding protein 2 n=1 Tax=Roseburia intestinalis TaxID=166486 RepID=A0A414T5R1_9FIRM|nr:penicillin-binding protein 2 [Roseburia intestinalis]RHG29515.1 penicillin-binding protein 2 [Roseburia intestinalis]
MAAKKRRKPWLKFPKRMQKKLIVMFSAIAVLLTGLIGRLMYIEYTSGDKYEKIVLSQQEYDSQTIPYQRGDIVDSKGTVLATSIAVYNVILDCSVMTSKDEYIEPTIQALASCFEDLDSNTLYGYAKDQKDSRYIVLKKKASYEEIQPFVEMQEAVDEKGKKVNPDIKGVWFEKEYQREYPYGALGSSIVGFTASGNVGVNGLEQYYNETLNGVDGREYGYLNTDNNFEKTIKAAKNGNTVVSTIDSHIQSVVEQKIADFNEAYTGNFREDEPGASHVGVLIMNPNNGDVLAMANYPNYDLSNPRDLSAYYTQEEIDAMDEDAQMDALNQLWQNFCTTYTYEPGSTAKPFTVAAGLETGKVSTGDSFYCDGYEHVGGHDIHCVNRSGHGMETLEQTLMNSCNDAMMQISYRLGSDIFTKYQQIFGFGQRTGIDLPGEARTDSLIYTADNMGPVDLATNAFGQNFNTTMIQLATAYCSLVNGGSLYQPYVVKRITDESGNTISEVTPTLLRETVSKSTSDALKQYMYSTVTGGTAVTAKVDGYSMGGKTGTAQKAGRDGVNYLVSFIGFAPVEDPQLVIYCVVDEPNVAEQFHSTYAQNIVREILEEVLPYMNIYRDEDTTGIHEGWGIKGEDEGDVGDVTAADVANSTAEESLDVPDTTDELPENTGEQPAEDIDPGSDEGQQ